jgi:hypothetical protein
MSSGFGRIEGLPHFNADPDPSFYFNADPDPAFHFDADPDTHLDPATHQNNANLRPLVYRPSILSLHASIVSVHGPPRLNFQPLKLLNLDFNVDSDRDPAFPYNADPDSAFHPKC